MTALSVEQQQALREAYAANAGVEEMKRIANCSGPHVYTLLRAMGVEIQSRRRQSNRPKFRRDVDREQLRRDHESKKFTSEELAEKHGICFNTLVKHLDEMGLLPHGLSHFNEERSEVRWDAFHNIENDETAQFYLGLLLADGCVLRRGGADKRSTITLGLKESDSETVAAFARFVNASWSTDRSGMTHCRFTSKRMAEKLAEYGVVPRKTYTLDCPEHVIALPGVMRGYICGDGYLHSSAKNPSPQISITSASKKFANKVYKLWSEVAETDQLRFRVLPKETARPVPLGATGKTITRRADNYVVTAFGWYGAGPIIDYYFSGASAASTMPRKQTIADYVIAGLRHRRGALLS